MLAPSEMPNQYLDWNRRYGSPFGFRTPNSFRNKILRKSHLIDWTYRWDPFAYQPNSSTRVFEYPWAFHVQSPPEGRVLEIGGGMSGFQFVLSRIGCRVVNIDPGQEKLRDSWRYNQSNFAELNRKFNTNVELRPTTIDNAGLDDNSFDRAYSISVLEHLPLPAVATIMAHVWRCLKPGSRFVITVDLFLNLAPFTRRTYNEYGTNIDIKWLLAQAPFILERGNEEELFGLDEFNTETILSKLEKYLVAIDYPALSQCMVLQKPA